MLYPLLLISLLHSYQKIDTVKVNNKLIDPKRERKDKKKGMALAKLVTHTSYIIQINNRLEILEA